MEYLITKKKVKVILDKNEGLRDDINKIVIAYWNDELNIQRKNIEALPFSKFSEMLLNGYLTSPEMIIKAITQLRMESPKYRGYSWLQTIGVK